MKKNLFFTLPLLTIILLWSSCKKDKSNDENEIENETQEEIVTFVCDTSFSYNTNVSPIFTSSCGVAFCHDAITAKKKMILENYTQIKDEVLNGNVMCAINQSCSMMPPSGKLPANDIAKIQCWIDRGTPNN